ncbi:hypothetical protein GGX14DRAFT_644123 [Mycena pura]|uniref:Uncharacterized protein n=1 Tax=Mycena pura TaxID=153505 RepID=A0AAD6YAQ6_9AGAR|nr:hypothetical protein GGX14DRAFT_644123 [Mycena pura]
MCQVHGHDRDQLIRVWASRIRTASGKVHTRGKRSGGTRHVRPRPKGFEIRRSSLKGRKAGQSSGGSGGNLGGLGQRPEGSELRGCETPKRRSSETPKRRNAETPKRRSSEVLKLRNVETLRRRRFWDGEKLRNSETPKHRNAEAPKRRGIVTPRHHGPRRFISGCEPPKSPRLRSAAASKHENARNPRNAEALRASEVVRLWLSPERGQQPGEEMNLGGVRRKGLYVLSLPADWPVWPQVSSERDRECAGSPSRRDTGSPNRRIAETLDLRITGHLSRRTYEAPKVVRRAPEVVRPIVDVGSEKGLRRLVATRRYWDAYGGTGRNVGASGGMRTGGTGCLQAVGCAEQARKGGVPLTLTNLTNLKNPNQPN